MALALAPGAVFAGDYEIVAPIGEGGMGAVYEVIQRSTGARRALKLMLPQLVSDPELRQRFERKARVGALVQSEHVAQVSAAGVDAATGAPFIVMELLRGKDLGKRRGPLPWREVHAIFSEIIHAIGAAHRAGVVHRDLKPENIFLAEARRADARTTVKVLDSGSRSSRRGRSARPRWGRRCGWPRSKPIEA